MNGPDHYAEAERLLGEASSAGWNNYEVAARFHAAAQVHATLALAAATAANIRRNGALPIDGPGWAGITMHRSDVGGAV